VGKGGRRKVRVCRSNEEPEVYNRCHRSASSTATPFSGTQPLRVPRRRWQWCSVEGSPVRCVVQEGEVVVQVCESAPASAAR